MERVGIHSRISVYERRKFVITCNSYRLSQIHAVHHKVFAMRRSVG